MIRSAVTISLVPEARGGPFVYWDNLPTACKKAKALGFDAVEIFPTAPDTVDPGQLRTLLADHGLVLAATGTGAGWVKGRLHLCLPDAAARAKARDFIRGIIDLAGQFQAPAIIGSMQGRYEGSIDQATADAYLTEALEELGAHAAQYKVPLLLEPLNRYETNMLNRIEDGVRFLKRLSTKNVALLADLFHMNIEEIDMAAAIRSGKGYIGHLHFVDSNRRAAGFGHLDYLPIVAALREIGYDGFVSAEVLPYPDSDAAALQTINTFRRLFGSNSATDQYG